MARITLHRVSIGAMLACLGGFAAAEEDDRDRRAKRNDRIRKAILDGLTYRVIADRFGLKPSTIGVYARVWNLPLRYPRRGRTERNPLTRGETDLRRYAPLHLEERP